MKRKQGISLIVLVITIIVMIILAASVVITLSNTGIIEKANNAVEVTNIKEIEQLASLTWAEEFMEGKRGETLKSAVLSKLQAYTDAYEIIVTDTGVTVIAGSAKPVNEYGFYYDTPYVAGAEDMVEVLVFKENGMAEIYASDNQNVLEPVPVFQFEASYEKGKITDGTNDLFIKGNGKTLEVTFEGGRKVEYKYIDDKCSGLYYGEKYYFTDEPGYTIFKENMTLEVYDEFDELKQTLTFSFGEFGEHSLVIDEIEYKLSFDGTVIVGLDGSGGFYIVSTYTNPNESIEQNGIIPLGGVYHKADGTILVASDTFPTPTTGDTYVYGDYIYAYNGYYMYEEKQPSEVSLYLALALPELMTNETQNGWGVRILDVHSYAYRNILNSIAGKPVVSLSATYLNCGQMIKPAENIHMLTNITSMREMFKWCWILPKLPNNFAISSTIKNISFMFDDCDNLTGSVVVNCNPTSYYRFLGSSGITEITGTTTMKTELMATKVMEK